MQSSSMLHETCTFRGKLQPPSWKSPSQRRQHSTRVGLRCGHKSLEHHPYGGRTSKPMASEPGRRHVLPIIFVVVILFIFSSTPLVFFFISSYFHLSFASFPPLPSHPFPSLFFHIVVMISLSYFQSFLVIGFQSFRFSSLDLGSYGSQLDVPV